MEHRRNVSTWLREYLFSHEIYLPQVAKDTGVPIEHLRMESDYVYTADEFMTLCSYLDMELYHFIVDGY